MSPGLPRGAGESERATALMYEGLCAFLCSRCVAMDHCSHACVSECVCMCVTLGAVMKEEELKLHQHKEINQSFTVINNKVIRSLVLL